MKILVVEDDLALSDVIAFTLRRAGFSIVNAHDGIAAIQTWEREQPDLVILDLNLPKLDGLVVCRHIRAQANTPIVMLTVRGGSEAVVAGLELGADDYIVKPFNPDEMVARVRGILRRAGQLSASDPLAAAGLTLDRMRNELVLQGGTSTRLTPLEARLLETLMLNHGRVLANTDLITAVWGPEGGSRAMLKQLVYRLRAKIEALTVETVRIETIPGVGYGLVEPNAEEQ